MQAGIDPHIILQKWSELVDVYAGEAANTCPWSGELDIRDTDLETHTKASRKIVIGERLLSLHLLLPYFT